MRRKKIMKTLTEQLPSSGKADGCTHDWQKVDGGSSDSNHIMMVCRREDCDASKLVQKPKVQESKSGKKLLLG